MRSRDVHKQCSTYEPSQMSWLSGRSVMQATKHVLIVRTLLRKQVLYRWGLFFSLRYEMKGAIEILALSLSPIGDRTDGNPLPFLPILSLLSWYRLEERKKERERGRILHRNPLTGRQAGRQEEGVPSEREERETRRMRMRTGHNNAAFLREGKERNEKEDSIFYRRAFPHRCTFNISLHSKVPLKSGQEIRPRRRLLTKEASKKVLASCRDLLLFFRPAECCRETFPSFLLSFGRREGSSSSIQWRHRLEPSSSFPFLHVCFESVSALIRGPPSFLPLLSHPVCVALPISPPTGRAAESVNMLRKH